MEEDTCEYTVCVLLCDFSEDALLHACCRRCLATSQTLFVKSACYRTGDTRRLVAQAPPEHRQTAQDLLAEYGTVRPATELSLSMTLEHFDCLYAQDAMEQIAEHPKA